MKPNKKFPEITPTAIFLNKYYKIIVLVIIIAVIVIGYIIVIKIKIFQTKERSSIVAEKRLELRDAEEYFKGLQQLEEMIKDFQKKNAQQVAKLEQILPTSPQIPELLAQVEAIVKRTEFNLTNLTLAEASETKTTSKKSKGSKSKEEGEQTTSLFGDLPDNLKVLQMNLTILGGNYFAFKDLLKDIEQHIRIFDITSLSFEGGGRDAPTEYSINLQTYYFEL